MKYFLDTEFIEERGSIELISIGLKCEDGRKYYAVSDEFNECGANKWVEEYVLPLIGDSPRKANNVIAKEVRGFIGNDTPDFWGYYCDYDWVVFCWLFGTMMDLPKNFPMYCNDIKQLMMSTGTEKIPDPEGEHNALIDAVWNERQFEACMQDEDKHRPMKQENHYLIIEATTSADLQSSVSSHIEQGWVPQGGVSTHLVTDYDQVQRHSDEYAVYFQAMIKGPLYTQVKKPIKGARHDIL